MNASQQFWAVHSTTVKDLVHVRFKSFTLHHYLNTFYHLHCCCVVFNFRNSQNTCVVKSHSRLIIILVLILYSVIFFLFFRFYVLCSAFEQCEPANYLYLGKLLPGKRPSVPEGTHNLRLRVTVEGCFLIWAVHLNQFQPQCPSSRIGYNCRKLLCLMCIELNVQYSKKFVCKGFILLVVMSCIGYF